MKIFRIEIENYRLLKNFSMDLEKGLSLVIGKNNTGKTSILSALNNFLCDSNNRFTFDDFNIEFKKELRALIENAKEEVEREYKEVGIRLRLFIEYDESDNLSNINRVMMDLDPSNNVIVLGFEYILDFNGYLNIRKEYKSFEAKENDKRREDEKYMPRDIYNFLRDRHEDFLASNKKSLAYDLVRKEAVTDKYIDLIKEGISTKDIISFQFISARRDVTNKGDDKTLSVQTSTIYKSTEASDEQNKAVEQFKDRLSATDTGLSDIYKRLFKDIVDKVRDFGGVRINESEIEIISTLQHKELLEGNTTVIYKHDNDHSLPEHYNGLGYMNLISMIFEIEILLHQFRREKDQRPADINLLFIEEPEAHTHPQMQYVFIKNIKKLLEKGIVREDGQNRALQFIISTHSACIVADSDFDVIKYLKKESSNSVLAKNLKDLAKEYEETQYQFLRQYLTINLAEIFFADKVILIEGDTERILLPTLMRKVDLEEKRKHSTAGTQDQFLPLLSQNISVVEIGAYSQVFEKFIDFLGIKTLIITDFDAIDNNKERCRVALGAAYSNSAIKFFYDNSSLNDLKRFVLSEKLFNKVVVWANPDSSDPVVMEKIWVRDGNGSLCIIYQTEEDGYHPTSFEDAFIHINRGFINSKKDDFKGLQNKSHFEDATKDAYDLAEQCVKKKTHFALDILYFSNADLSNWKIPSYINEGLLWLKKD